MWKFMMTSGTAFAVAALSGAQVQAATYIRLPSGTVMPKHKCLTSPCVDCTFFDYKTCYEQADKFGLIDKNVGFKLLIERRSRSRPSAIDLGVIRRRASPIWDTVRGRSSARCRVRWQSTRRRR
jgi:hypothetical protein